MSNWIYDVYATLFPRWFILFFPENFSDSLRERGERERGEREAINILDKGLPEKTRNNRGFVRQDDRLSRRQWGGGEFFIIKINSVSSNIMSLVVTDRCKLDLVTGAGK